ncbi:MAG: pyrroline-5-carboxylate reductase [bacterium]|nr:pyrroline-5-carboxylate reductase [bacterium]
MLKDNRIAFIGAGNMAEALMRGILFSKLVKPSVIIASDALGSRVEHISRRVGVQATRDNQEAIKDAGIIFLAVKPNMIDTVLSEIGTLVTKEQMIISIAAGISIARIEKQLANKVPVIRAMPNTPALVLEGATAICAGSYASKAHLETAQQLLGSVGKVVVVTESVMDTVTGLSGSGPAYIFMVIEALADAGVKEGLMRDVAQLLAAQTVLGAAKMVLQTGEHPAALKDKVASPGGTTIAGIAALESAGLKKALIQAVSAATARSKELSKQDK